jgi:hypothetical protein
MQKPVMQKPVMQKPVMQKPGPYGPGFRWRSTVVRPSGLYRPQREG